MRKKVKDVEKAKKEKNRKGDAVGKNRAEKMDTGSDLFCLF